MTPENASAPADYHTHTFLCKHAQGAPADYVRSAVARGIREIAITDHDPTPHGYDITHRMPCAEFETYRRLVDEARMDGCEVLFGVEADYYEGCMPHLSRWLASQEFDIVLGSVHCIDVWSLEDPTRAELRRRDRVLDLWQRYFALVGALADTRLYDVVAHLDLPKRSGVAPDETKIAEFVQPALDRIAAASMAIEVNTSGLRHPINEVYPSPTILGWAHQRGIPITFGSDAHQPDHVGASFDHAVRVAWAAGYRESLRFRRRRRTPVPLPPPGPTSGSG